MSDSWILSDDQIRTLVKDIPILKDKNIQDLPLEVLERNEKLKVLVVLLTLGGGGNGNTPESIVLKISLGGDIIDEEAHCNRLVYEKIKYVELYNGDNLIQKYTALAENNESAIVYIPSAPSDSHKMIYTRFEGSALSVYGQKTDDVYGNSSTIAIIKALSELYSNFIHHLNFQPIPMAHNDLKLSNIAMSGYIGFGVGFSDETTARAIDFGHLTLHEIVDPPVGTFHGLGTCFNITSNGIIQKPSQYGDVGVVKWNQIKTIITSTLTSSISAIRKFVDNQAIRKLKRTTQLIPKRTTQLISKRIITLELGQDGYNTDVEFILCLCYAGYEDDIIIDIISRLINLSEFRDYKTLGNFVVLPVSLRDAYATAACMGSVLYSNIIFNTKYKCNKCNPDDITRQKIQTVVNLLIAKLKELDNDPPVRGGGDDQEITEQTIIVQEEGDSIKAITVKDPATPRKEDEK